ncbi:hypothetical protein EXE53_20590 [Halorubrum sp. SD626R]|nr:hypothetical protein EXE53_20590 [Halorubrum sp. SD626R]
MTPRELRADVPALSEAAYFNFGAHGPSPRYVVEAAASFVEDHEFGSATTDPYEYAFGTYDTVRERIAADDVHGRRLRAVARGDGPLAVRSD